MTALFIRSIKSTPRFKIYIVISHDRWPARLCGLEELVDYLVVLFSLFITTSCLTFNCLHSFIYLFQYLLLEAFDMARDKIHEPPHGLIKTTRHADDNIQGPAYHDPQDDDILITRTGKQPVLKVCTLYGVLFEKWY